MKAPKFLSAGFLSLALIFSMSNMVHGFSIREFLGLDNKDEEQKKTETMISENKMPEKKQQMQEESNGKQAANINGINLNEKLEFNEIQNVTSLLNDEQKKILLSDKDVFKNLIKQESSNKSILNAAIANNIHNNPKTNFILQRNTESLIRKIYLNQLIKSKIPADFPTEQQVTEYYENNKDRFKLLERVHVWQIFLPFDKDKKSTKDIELLKKKVETIKKDLEKGKIDYAEAAKKNSAHEGSLTTGGFMGLVKIKDLKEEIKKPLLETEEGKLTNPVMTDEGIHLLKRGPVFPSETLELARVKNQIEEILRRQLNNQVRKAIFEQARETYPVDIDEKKIEEWRLKLRTNL